MVLIKSTEHKSEKHVSVAASEECYLISTSLFFIFSYAATKYLFSKKSLPPIQCLFNMLTSVLSTGGSTKPVEKRCDKS